MTTVLYQENLAALRRRHKQAIGELPPDTCEHPASLERIPGWDQAVRKGEFSGHLILLGLGSGDEVVRLWKEMEQTIDLLIIFERDVKRAQAVLSQVHLVSILDDGRVHLFIGLPAEELRRHLHPLRYALGTSTPTILDLAEEPSLTVFRQAVEEELLLLRQNAELILHEKGRMLFNILRNLPATVSATPVQSLRGRCASQPAFVIAAGPSLNKNISLLSQAREHGWLIAVDTALAPLKQAGVEPHLLVTCDPTPLNERHFAGWPDLNDAILAFHPEVHAEIPRTYLGKTPLLALHDGQSRLLRCLGLAPRPGDGVARGAMTGHLAFNLAVYLGCDPIVLVGMDLAFPPAGGRTHAVGTALGRPVRIDSGSRATVETIPGVPREMETELVDLPGVEGGNVQGPPIFRTYLRLMEQEIARSGRRVVDATEGGTSKARTRAMSLHEAVQSVQLGSRPAAGHSVHETPATPRPPLASMLEVLAGGRQRLRALKEWAFAARDAAEWRRRLLSDPDDWLLPAYEALIYRAHNVPAASGPDEDEARSAEFSKELVSVCDHFNLFILGAERELANILHNPPGTSTMA